jgi:predicted RND superfamily exporter protein
MVFLDIGLKTATLPVVALGVGIGVDYGIYIFAVLQRELENGVAFTEALFRAFRDTGAAVVFTGLTLAAGVGTWAQSALKFQADMGVLLSFMFLVNMLAAVLLLPALALWLYRRPSLRTSS